MSVINQMLRDLDKRGAAAPAVPPASSAEGAAALPTSAAAQAFAEARLPSGRGRVSRNLLLAGGVAAMLPIAWAATQFDRGSAPAASFVATVTPPPAVRVATATMAVAPVAITAPTQATPPPSPAADVAVLPQAATPPTEPAPAQLPAAEAAPPSAAIEAAPPRTAAAPIEPSPLPSAAKPRPARVAMPETTELAEPKRKPASPASDTRLAMASPVVPKEETRIERRPTDQKDDLTRAGEAMSIGRNSDAIVLLRKVIQAEPDNERARLALLSLLAERGRDDTWRNTLAESARALPKRFGLAAAQGMAESGRFDQSLAILQALPEAVRDARYFSALGATHQQLNQHGDAVAAFESALQLAPGGSPQLPSLLVAQALSMQTLGKTADARRNLERVRQMPEAAADVRDFASRELAHSR